MTGVTSHPAVFVRQLRRVATCAAPGVAVLLDGLGEPRFLAVARVPGSNGVDYLYHLPFLFFLQHRALKEATSFPVEAVFTPRCAEPLQCGAASRRGNA